MPTIDYMWHRMRSGDIWEQWYKHYDKRDEFIFPIVNFPFISSNISASPAYGVYISELERYSRVCAQYHDFLDRAQLLTQKLLKQGYVALRLKSSQSDWRLQNIHISNDNGSFTFYVDVFFPLSLPRLLPDLTVYMSNMADVF
jgi:hypothetical protein